MRPTPRYRIPTSAHVSGAYLVGATVGACLSSAVLATTFENSQAGLLGYAGPAIAGIEFALPVWLLALPVFGGPAWLISRSLGRRGGLGPSLIGAGILGVVAFAFGGWRTWRLDLALSCVGGVVGLMVWRVAYRRVVENPAEAPS